MRSPHHPAPGSRAHPLRVLAASGFRVLKLVALALGATSVGAQAPSPPAAAATVTDTPVVAVHYQDIPSGAPATIDVFIPPPMVDWTEFSYTASECLKADSVHAGPPGKALIVRFEVESEGPCATRVDLQFGTGASSWSAAALIVVNRLPQLPEATGVQPTFSTARLHVPNAGPHDQLADVMLLGLTNTGSTPLTVVGFGDNAAFASLIGQVFSYEPASFAYRYEDLARHGAPFEPTEVAAGATAHFALLFDANGRLPTGAGTITMQAVAIIERDGQQHTLAFPRLSSAWGTELP